MVVSRWFHFKLRASFSLSLLKLTIPQHKVLIDVSFFTPPPLLAAPVGCVGIWGDGEKKICTGHPARRLKHESSGAVIGTAATLAGHRWQHHFFLLENSATTSLWLCLMFVFFFSILLNGEKRKLSASKQNMNDDRFPMVFLASNCTVEHAYTKFIKRYHYYMDIGCPWYCMYFWQYGHDEISAPRRKWNQHIVRPRVASDNHHCFNFMVGCQRRYNLRRYDHMIEVN